MFGRFLPRETSFFDFFEQHAAITVQACRELLSLSADGGNFTAKARRISEIEHEADTITHRCVEALHKTFITPLERDDIHRLISRMDDIVDYVEAAAERITIHKLHDIRSDVKELAEVLLRAAEVVEQAIKGLRDLSRVAEVTKLCIDINRLENEADSLLRNATVRLFEEEQDVRTLLKWKEVYENLENATDRCEDVANIIEGIMLEHA